MIAGALRKCLKYLLTYVSHTAQSISTVACAGRLSICPELHSQQFGSTGPSYPIGTDPYFSVWSVECGLWNQATPLLCPHP